MIKFDIKIKKMKLKKKSIQKRIQNKLIEKKKGKKKKLSTPCVSLDGRTQHNTFNITAETNA